MWKILLLLLLCSNTLSALTLRLDNYRDRKFDFSWNVSLGTYAFQLYFSTSPLSEVYPPPPSFMVTQISTTTMASTTFYFNVTLPLAYNQSFATAYAVLCDTRSATWSNVILQEIQIRSIWFDVDADGVLEETADTDDNILNGYEIYRDSNFSSKSYKGINVGSTKAFLIDTTLDNYPSLLWIPETQKIYPLLSRNVDRDTNLEYEVGGGFIHSVLGGRVFYDVDTGKFIRFCIIKGTAKDSEGNPSVATIEVWAGTNKIISSSVTGSFEIYVGTITYEGNYKFIARKSQNVSIEKSEFIEHGNIYQLGDFTFYVAVSEQNKVKIFPVPTRDKITFAVDVSVLSTIKVDILDLSGGFVERLIDDIAPPGFFERSVLLNLPSGYYFVVSFIGNNKTVTKIRIRK